MRLIPTETPCAKLHEDRVIAHIQSGPTMLEISMTLHEALNLATTLQMAAVQPIRSRRVAQILAFDRKRARHAGGAS